MPETITLSSETLIEFAAKLYAVEDFLTLIWGSQEGGEGGIADRIGAPVSELLGEAFGDGWSDDDGPMAEASDRAAPIVDLWLRDLGGVHA